MFQVSHREVILDGGLLDYRAPLLLFLSPNVKYKQEAKVI